MGSRPASASSARSTKTGPATGARLIAHHRQDGDEGELPVGKESTAESSLGL